jgi:hypothetical protein
MKGKLTWTRTSRDAISSNPVDILRRFVRGRASMCPSLRQFTARLCLFLSVSLAGCATGQLSEPNSAGGPFSSLSSVVLPRGESFYTDKSREIERSLKKRSERIDP